MSFKCIECGNIEDNLNFSDSMNPPDCHTCGFSCWEDYCVNENKRRSKQQERNLAKKLSGRPTPATGAKWHSKGDVRSEIFLAECKTTTKGNYRLTKNVWLKIKNESTHDSLRVPIMEVEIKGTKFTVFGRARFQFIKGINLKIATAYADKSYNMVLEELSTLIQDANEKGETFVQRVLFTNKLHDKNLTEYVYIMESTDFDYAVEVVD